MLLTSPPCLFATRQTSPRVTVEVVLVASLALAVDVVGGQPAPSGSPTLAMSLEECVRRGDNHSPFVRRSHGDRRVVAARRVGASLIVPTNPFAALIVGPRRTTVPGWRSGAAVHGTPRADPGDRGQRGARRAVVEKAMDVAAAREALALSETRARVRSAYMAGSSPRPRPTPRGAGSPGQPGLRGREGEGREGRRLADRSGARRD